MELVISKVFIFLLAQFCMGVERSCLKLSVLFEFHETAAALRVLYCDESQRYFPRKASYKMGHKLVETNQYTGESGTDHLTHSQLLID